LGFVAVVTAGTLTGFLILSESGSKTRKKINKELQNVSKELLDTLNEKVNEVKKQLNQVVDEIRDKAQEAEKTIKEKAGQKARANAMKKPETA
jgi:gas vesicle protein